MQIHTPILVQGVVVEGEGGVDGPQQPFRSINAQ